MVLDLPSQFTFAQFKRANPISPDALWELVFSRNTHTIQVKQSQVTLGKLQSILEATFQLANRVGFGAMTLRDLSKATGLSMGGLYGYLGSKDALASMVEDFIRHLAYAIPSWFDRPTLAPLERLDSTLRAHVFLSELFQPWFFFVFMESRALGPEQRKVARTADLEFQAALSKQIVAISGPGNSHSAFLLASHLQGMAQDWHVKRWKYRAEKISVDEFADSLSALVASRLRK